MKPKAQHKHNGPLEALPTARPGDRVVRRLKKRQGALRAITRSLSKLLGRTASK